MVVKRLFAVGCWPFSYSVLIAAALVLAKDLPNRFYDLI
jgi:hypothetical protein